MQCPACQSTDDKVLESRTIQGGVIIRRRRECNACNFRFTTYEKIEAPPLMVIKKDGRKQPFDKKKILHGLQRAFEKRPILFSQIKELATEIEDDIRHKVNFEISSEEIGKITLQKIYKIDQVAYLRFASVYQTFDSVDEFKILVNQLKNHNNEQLFL